MFLLGNEDDASGVRVPIGVVIQEGPTQHILAPADLFPIDFVRHRRVETVVPSPGRVTKLGPVS